MVCQLFIVACNFTMETKMEGQFVIGSLFPLLLVPGVVKKKKKKKSVFVLLYIHYTDITYLLVAHSARLGRKTELTNGCIIGAKVEVTSQEVIPENTVIYGAPCERRVQSERPPVSRVHMYKGC